MPSSSAANHSLLGGGGVDGAIHRRGGPEILAECQSLRKDKYRRIASWPGRGDDRGSTEGTLGDPRRRADVCEVKDKSQLLADCFRNSLRIADELGAATVAFPAISTGVYRWPVDDAARIALETVQASESRVDEVRFVLFDQRAYDAFTAQASSSEG